GGAEGSRTEKSTGAVRRAHRAKAEVMSALKKRIETLQQRYPGVGLIDLRGEMQISIPEEYRTGHEAHFGEVTRRFLEYLQAPQTLPAWEKPNMLAKYHVTTAGVARAQQ